MAVFNGSELNAEAYAIARAIEECCEASYMRAGFNIAPVKTRLRDLYKATGGRRKTEANKATVTRDPTADEYRAIYNGLTTGEKVLAGIIGNKVPEGADKPDAAPAPRAPVIVADDGEEARKLALLKELIGGGQKIDEGGVRAIVDARLSDILAIVDGKVSEAVAKAVRTVEVKIAGKPDVKIDRVHAVFETVLLFAANRRNVMLVGPAGSGKTTLAVQIAKALALPFYMAGKTNDEIKITGYRDGNGTYHDTMFRRAFETGGLFLFDEMDGWSADALIAANAPLAGDFGEFPDGMVSRHKNFVVIAACNTFGRGADRQYVGREQLDAATLDRFAVIEMDYDEELEMLIACNPDWTLHVQKVRKAVAKEKVRHIVSPRASIDGGVMIQAGMKKAAVEEAYIWKGLDETLRNRVKAAMR